MNIEWYCCNYCFTKLINADKPFSLTQCGHIFCSKCIVGAQNVCPQCKTTNVAFMTLNIPLEPRLSVFFASYETMLENIQKAIKFQNMQMVIVMQKFMKSVEKYSAMKKEYWILMQKVEHLKKKIKAMEIEAKQKELVTRQKHSVLSPFLVRNEESNYRASTSSINSSTSFLRNQISKVHFSPNLTPKNTDSVFRVPLSVNVPRSSRRSSGGSTGSQKRTPFSDYSPTDHY